MGDRVVAHLMAAGDGRRAVADGGHNRGSAADDVSTGLRRPLRVPVQLLLMGKRDERGGQVPVQRPG
jgi:hypothetical protein